MEVNKPRRNLLFKLRPVLRWLLKLRGSTKAIAGGLGLGMFIAFTPTVGLQVVGALVIATFLNLNRAAAVLPVWITNPLTVAPIYTFNYWVGRQFWEGPPVGEVSKKLIDITRELTRLDFYEVGTQVTTFMHLGKEIIVPLIVGSFIISTISGVLTYWSSYQLLELWQRRKKRKKQRAAESVSSEKD